jgi:NADH:ubiquinone oxidoreductase subunit 2 (subunit N)
VVSLVYYVRVIRDMFLADPVPEARPIPMTPALGLLTLTFLTPTIVLGIWWSPLAGWVAAAMK